jgi:hypothetical protein
MRTVPPRPPGPVSTVIPGRRFSTSITFVSPYFVISALFTMILEAVDSRRSDRLSASTSIFSSFFASSAGGFCGAGGGRVRNDGGAFGLGCRPVGPLGWGIEGSPCWAVARTGSTQVASAISRDAVERGK